MGHGDCVSMLRTKIIKRFANMNATPENQLNLFDSYNRRHSYLRISLTERFNLRFYYIFN